jgi:hypothetical protein
LNNVLLRIINLGPSLKISYLNNLLWVCLFVETDQTNQCIFSLLSSCIKENREEYWKQRDALLNQYEGKYIAFSNGKVLGCSDDPYEIATYIEKDSTIFTTLVGKEKKQSTVDKVLLLDDNRRR